MQAKTFMTKVTPLPKDDASGPWSGSLVTFSPEGAASMAVALMWRSREWSRLTRHAPLRYRVVVTSADGVPTRHIVDVSFETTFKTRS